MTLIQEKTRQAVDLCREFGVDCWITFTRESEINGDPTLVYLAPGPVTWHSAFIIDARGNKRAIIGLYDKQGIEDTGAYDSVTSFVTGIKEPLMAALKELAPKTIALNYSIFSEICDGLTHGMYLTIKSIIEEALPSAVIIPAEKIVSAVRERKSPSELDAMRKAVAVTEDIFGAVASFISPGRTEREIAAFMLAEVRKRGVVPAWGTATCPAVFTGPDTAQAHYSPTDRKVERGHALNMDFGVKVDGYCSDRQRSFYILERDEQKAPREVMRGFETILKSIEDSRLAMKPGVEGFRIDDIARSVVTKAGYAEFPHAVGHQVGRYAHDGTALLGPKWEKYLGKVERRLEPGMVFTLEPRLTVPDRGVVTVEEMVVVTETGAEYLGKPQRELTLIG